MASYFEFGVLRLVCVTLRSVFLSLSRSESPGGLVLLYALITALYFGCRAKPAQR